ncbi:MAG: leucine--tRNA ligase [Parcubacteria group bacterium RIFCSPLOWO2_02_FULL_40_12]|nr:MAG: leucine--tRNA ligase [Parcubacteria group bacterium RIFCSPLOWO2_02_FULL_40_12]
MPKYNPSKIESKWQRFWKAKKLYFIKDKIKDKQNFYNLVMFPYPSGDLHMGHWYNYAPADVYGRFKRMQGFNVMSPIGFDAFGLPAENAAIKNKLDPKVWTYGNIKSMKRQLDSIGAAFDWSREIITAEPNYYKWTQWIFLKLYEAGLAKKEKVLANWCSHCKTILANEQVQDGRCERCDTVVEQKLLEQWVFKITDYAQKLLDGLEKIDWPETTKILQRNWIGRSDGAIIKFQIPNSKDSIDVFTTRPDTIFGATFLVLAPEHELVKRVVKDEQLGQVNNYLEKTKKKTELERLVEVKEKTGVFTGAYAFNPATKEKIPVWISDFVLPHYGTGAIMAVPAHDQRDLEFAEKFNLPVKEAGLDNEIFSRLSKEGFAERKINYRLHDWIISRQRYWGAPIPMILCQKCGWQPVSEKDLPVLLPKINDYKPSSSGQSPLAKSEKFIKTKCPKCFGEAQRETDTMDTFVDSAWYFLRYADPQNKKEFVSKEKLKSWLPVSIYIGGQEHAAKHLLYARFITKVLHDSDYLHFDEPFSSLRHQGLILGPDGNKMSKSRGNVVNPDDYVKKYGSDTIRMHLCFMGPYENGGPWDPKAIVGVYRFLNRVWSFANKKPSNEKLEKIFHKAIKKVGEDIKNLRFNTAVSELMKLLNEIEDKELAKEQIETFLKLMAPFAPHLTEELWHQLGNKKSIHLEKWPEYDPKLIKEEIVDIIIQINGKARDIIKVQRDLKESKIRELVLASEKIKIYISGKEINRFIYIFNKLVNIVL